VGIGVEIKGPRRDSDNVLPPSAEVKNEWSYISTRVSYIGDLYLIMCTNTVPRT